MGEGFIKLHRCLLEKPIWTNSTPEQKTILVTLLIMANFKTNEWEWQGKKFKCQPGQFITSLQSIKEASGFGISTQNIRTALVRFEKLGFLTNKSTKTGRFITLVNWGLYQIDDYKLTKKLTKTSQRPHKDLTTIEECKNDKNDKNEDIKYTYAEFVHMTSAEHARLIDEYGDPFIKRCIEVLDNYKGANNKTYANDYRAIKTWVIKRVQEDQAKENPIPKIPRGIQSIIDYGSEEH